MAKILEVSKIRSWLRGWEIGTLHHTGDGKVNWYNTFEGQLDIYQKCKGTDLVLRISMKDTIKYAKVFVQGRSFQCCYTET